MNTFTISSTYRKETISNYLNKLNLADEKESQFAFILNEYRNVADNKLKELFVRNLSYLEEKGFVSTSKRLVIVIGNEYIPITDIEKIDLSYCEALEMLEKAKEVALETLDKKYGNKYNINTVNDVMRVFKINEYKQIYNAYILKEYGWSNTFEEIVINFNGDSKNILITKEEYINSRNSLNKKLVNAIKANIETKYRNLIMKYNEEEDRIVQAIECNDDLTELIDLGIIDKDGVFENKMFRYPEVFLDYLNMFIETEVQI